MSLPSVSEESCFLCLRITPQDLAKVIHTLPLTKEGKHKLLIEASDAIREVYQNKPTFFCGNRKVRIIGGLLYYLLLEHKEYIDLKLKKKLRPFAHPDSISQLEVAHAMREVFGNQGLSELSVRHGYWDWRKIEPKVRF